MLTDLQRRKLTRYFRVYDIDDDGRIAAADFERVVENVRILHGLPADSPAHRELRDAYLTRWRALRDSADVDGDGGVDLEEWLGYWDEVLRSDDRYEAEVAAVVRRLFHLFDTDEDGVLGPQEFADFFGIYGLGLDLARTTFRGLDIDRDGTITRGELVEIGHEFYRGDDPDAPANRLYGPLG